jgi:hypothetical protein
MTIVVLQVLADGIKVRKYFAEVLAHRPRYIFQSANRPVH